MLTVRTFKKLSFLVNYVNKFLYILMTVVCINNFCFAQNYTIKNTSVSVQDKYANSAKAKAIEKGAKDAYLIMMRKFGKIHDKEILKDILDIVESYEIVSESITDHSYKAVINYSFELDSIDSISDYDFKIATQKTIIIPIMNFEQILWPISVNDSWYKAWQDNIQNHQLSDFIIPTVFDLSLVKLNKKIILIDDVDDFLELSSNLQSDKLILALSNVNYDKAKAIYKVNIEIKSFLKKDNHFIWKRTTVPFMLENANLDLIMDQLVIKALEAI